MHFIAVLAAVAGAQQSPAASGEENIVVTASREPVPEAEAAVSATLFGSRELQSLALPLASDVLRLSPGVSVSVSGARGTQAEVRIRGAEADHSLLFVDGIRFNDPAAGNAPRFELLATDLLSRIEVVRGPQSALWGSDALGGVIAVETPSAAGGDRVAAVGEYGGHESARASAQFAARSGSLGISGSAGWLRSEGIDIFSERGERDGFENRSASFKAVFNPASEGELGVTGHYVEGESAFDGYDATGFADTLDATENRIFAVRGWGALKQGGWSLLLDGSYLDSANRNRLDDAPVNSTFGKRFTLGAQLSGTIGAHRLTAAAEHEGENFKARDVAYFGSSDQDRSRNLTALVGEWRAAWSEAFLTDLAVRRDIFSAYDDATTVRGTALLRPSAAWTVHVSYGEGIAQPTFYDLYGFSPSFFTGNPDLRPERSRGWEAGLRWRSDAASIGVTGFSNRLRDEILTVYNPDFSSTAVNATGKSRRRGIEVDARYRWRAVSLAANYTYLDADEQKLAGRDPIREARRPRHSANLIAAGSVGPIDLGAALAYVGKRQDAGTTLDDYVLGSLKLGWRVAPSLEAYARVENLFDADYQDVLGYHTPGRTVYAGLRLGLGR